MDGETDISGGPFGISMPREPVDDNRTSIKDRGFEGVESAVDSTTFARGVIPGFT
jgi:hypothetical protein